MSDETTDLSSRARLVDAVIAAYLAAEDQGQMPDREAILAKHPDLESELRSFFANHDAAGPPVAHLQTGGKEMPDAEAKTVTRHDTDSVLYFDKLNRVGDYEILEEIGRGGMGVVYKARHTVLDCIRAVKIELRGRRASATDIMRFRLGARALANMDHPNIVQVCDVGEHQGHCYFGMKWIEGGSLAAHIERYRKDPRAAAQLLLQIARTMQYAHECRVLHRDLKPSNILLDIDGRPYVIDFGLAYFVDYQLDLTGDGQILGTAPYMSPEQAEGRKDSFTPATDVYGLGAILYELLTGRPPFRAATLLETIRQVLESDPVPPRTLNRAVDQDLQRICLKCLEKDPRWRYSSAGGLAIDLERWLEGESIGPRPGLLKRIGRFCQRRPAVVTLASLAIGLLAVAWLLEDRERCEVARGNLYAAKFVANTVLGELEDLATPVAQAAHDPRLRELLAPHGASGLQAYVEQVARSAAPEHGSADPSAESPYETWFVLDAAGKILAVAPLNPRIIGRDFSGRDYFQGAERHAGEPGEAAVHVSRVFRAENDGLWKFALAAPICDGDEPDARVLGVVATTITTTSTLGPVGLDDDRRTVVLAGREDPNPPAGKAVAPRPSSYLILRHPAYHRGDPAVPVTGEWLRPLDRTRHGDEFRYTDAPEHLDPRKATDLGYHDPLATQDAAYAGRWLLGAAPVGVTELVVLVQQRAPILGVSPWSGFTSALGAILFGIAGYGAFRALRRQGN